MKLTFKQLIVLFIFILIVPLTIYLSSQDWSPSFESQNSMTVPKKIDQPKDTQIASEPIPIHHWKTRNGIATYFVPTEGLPMVDIVVTLSAGSARDGNQPGLASLTSSLLDEGTKTRSAEVIARTFEDVGAIYDTDVDRDRIRISLRSLTDPVILAPVIDLLAEILAKPAFSDISIQQLKNQILVSLKKEQQQPGMIAARAFFTGIYPNHPYGHLIVGTPKSVSNISRTDIVQFHQNYFVNENAIITIVGGLHRDRAKSLSETIAAALLTGKKAAAIPDVIPLAAGADNRIPFPSQQTHVILGQPCCAVIDPDYFPLLVGNYILGEGSLVARLFKEVRDKRGLVYSVVSRFTRLQKPGPFTINLQTQTTKASEAIQTMKDTFAHFIKEGPTDAEMTAAKKGIIGGFPITIGNNAQIAEMISNMTFYGLPINFLNTYQTQVEKVTKEDVRKAFEKHLDPNKMLLVVVGG